ncbi:SDR family NAD(P)-dependent oxidoreductase [Streptomyces blattellae]|uniref:SDR family NAD(P)-dependent oxidoreductase n=1 Tax=Streptomyces blattellae TaxID=2569855 RepID=UPI0012B88C39|nr:SDR family NAD(P)-dependent oxidoreductase [Streptomyces blattellae]
MSEMQGRVCVITGGTGGIGRATALALAKQGATVVVLGRSRERGERARAEIAQESGNDKVELVIADLAAQDDVRRAAAELLQRHAKIHVLVNNAAVMLPKREVTGDGIEKMFATNYLSHFLLTNLLLDRLKASAPARIVSVGALIRGARIDLDDLMLEKGKYSSFAALGPSKLAVVLFTRELARRLDGTGVTANALYPGMAKTAIMDESSWLMKTSMHLMSGTPEKGARTSVFLASDPGVAGVTGKMFAKCREVPMRGAQLDDEELWQRLWDRSAQLTELA